MQLKLSPRWAEFLNQRQDRKRRESRRRIVLLTGKLSIPYRAAGTYDVDAAPINPIIKREKEGEGAAN